MRLYCINNKKIPGNFNTPEALAAVKEGRDYKGEEILVRTKSGKTEKGWRVKGFAYCITRFVPLPEQTADEMQEEECEAIVNLETVMV